MGGGRDAGSGGARLLAVAEDMRGGIAHADSAGKVPRIREGHQFCRESPLYGPKARRRGSLVVGAGRWSVQELTVVL